MPAKRPRRRRHAHWAAYLWPGLPHLWIEASVAGLALALAFSVLLNVLVLGVLVWPEWLPTRLKLACALCAGVLWLAALWETRGELRRIAARREAEENADGETNEPEEAASALNDELLREAQRRYLRGDWVAAERDLRRALRRDRRDVEAAIWHATLLLRTGRERAAARRLRRLALLDDAAPWRFEIEQQLARTAPPRADAATESPDPPTLPTNENPNRPAEPATAGPAPPIRRAA